MTTDTTAVSPGEAHVAFAMNHAADLIEDWLKESYADPDPIDLVNLVVNVAINALEHPDDTLSDAVHRMYSSTDYLDDIAHR